MLKKYSYLPLSILFFLGIFLFSCTNPEVDFPEEDKKKTKVSTPKLNYETPTLLVYPEGSSPEIFYYFIALARNNGASDSLFIPVSADQKAITQGLKELKTRHGKKPSVFAVHIDPILFVNQNNKVKHFVFLEPKRPTTESEKISVFDSPKAASPQIKTEATQNTKKGNDDKKPSPLKKETEKLKNTPKKTEEAKIKKENSAKNSNSDDKASAKKTPVPIKKPENSKTTQTPSKNAIAAPSYREKLKDFNFLSKVIYKLIPEPELTKDDKQKTPKKLSLTTSKAIPEETLYIKGKTFPYSKLSLMEMGKKDKWSERFSVASNRNGQFNALIIRPAKNFKLQLQYENNKKWNFRIMGLQFTSPFFLFSPQSDSIAEIHSFFSPLPIDKFDLANKPQLKSILEKLKKNVSNENNQYPVHSLYFQNGELKVEQNKNALIIRIPEKMLPIYIKIEKKTIDIKAKNSLYLLN